MTDAHTTETNQPKKSSALKPILIVGIGCLVLLVLGSIAITASAGFLFSRFGGSLLKGAVEQATGVKMKVDDLKEGKTSFTDPKTGQTVNVGASDELPKTFPKDFPIYSGAKVAGSLSGGAANKNGFFVTLTTPDEAKTVATYYETELPKNGWEITNTANLGKLVTLTFTKGTSEGAVTITPADESAKDTTILIAFGEK